MLAAKFCSECGERLSSRRPGFLFRTCCPRCAVKLRPARLILISISIVLAVGGFALGNYSKTPEPFYVIGTPIDLGSTRQPGVHIGDQSTGVNKGTGSETLSPSGTRAIETICGAPTKSGRPCRRKVKGVGYCWQHRTLQHQINQSQSNSPGSH